MSSALAVYRSLSQMFDLPAPEQHTREAMLAAIAAGVSELLRGRAETFFQIMYRFDLPEEAVVRALQRGDEAVDELAVLIYERQLKKLEQRRQQGFSGTGDADLAW